MQMEPQAPRCRQRGSHAEVFGHLSFVGANFFLQSERRSLGTAIRGAGGVFLHWTSPKLTPFVRDDDHKGFKQAPLRPTSSDSNRIIRQKVVSERVCFGAVAQIAGLVMNRF